MWTSAGVAAGIDLSLAMIASDLGETMSQKVAQELVVYHLRLGSQSQFSSLLSFDSITGLAADGLGPRALG